MWIFNHKVLLGRLPEQVMALSVILRIVSSFML